MLLTNGTFPLHGTGSTLLAFFCFPLGKSTFLVPNLLRFQKKQTRYYEVLKGDVKTLQTTDWLERMVTASLHHRCLERREYPEQCEPLPAIFKQPNYCSSRSFNFFLSKMAIRKITPWSLEEVQTFLTLLADERIQRELDGSTCNERVYQQLSEQMTAHSYHQTFSSAVKS